MPNTSKHKQTNKNEKNKMRLLWQNASHKTIWQFPFCLTAKRWGKGKPAHDFYNFFPKRNIWHWDQNSFSAIKWSQLGAQWTFLRSEDLIPEAGIETYNLAASKHDLKPSVTFFEKLHATLDSQVMFLWMFAPRRATLATELYVEYIIYIYIYIYII